MHIVIVAPEIAPNTGNIARICAATHTSLHLIEPLGFQLDDKTLKRAGMDYWQQVQWKRWQDWQSFAASIGPDARLWLVESNGPQSYGEVSFGADDYLVFGRETAGLPTPLLEQYSERWIRIPMMNLEARSLNLSNCVAIVLYEALRQNGFSGDTHLSKCPSQNPTLMGL